MPVNSTKSSWLDSEDLVDIYFFLETRLPQQEIVGKELGHTSTCSRIEVPGLSGRLLLQVRQGGNQRVLQHPNILNLCFIGKVLRTVPSGFGGVFSKERYGGVPAVHIGCECCLKSC